MPAVVVEDVEQALRAPCGPSTTSRSRSPTAGSLTLLGPSGCGKTTTLRMIAGLEQNDTGRITIGDRIVSDPARGLFVAPERREIGMVFQSYAIWPHMTVFANVAYPLEVRHRPAAEVRERVLERAPAHGDGAARRAAGHRALGRPAAAGRHRPRAGVRSRACS